MSAAALLERLQAQGVSLTADGEQLRVRPAGKLTDEIRAELRASKPVLLALLKAPPARPSPIPRSSTRQGIETLLVELQPHYGWEADELAMLRAWSERDAEGALAQLRASRHLAVPNQTAALLADCDRLIDELAELTGDKTLAEQFREERRRSSLANLLEARDHLREAVQRAKATAQRQYRRAGVAV